jgi:hypothetical protein
MTNRLFRQVHPNHLKNGLSSAAFRPTPSDKDMLSVDCARLTTAETSFQLHLTKTKKLADGSRANLETAGTWAITREICTENELAVTPDPVKRSEFQPANEAHHLVDFSTIAGNPSRKNENVSKRLKQVAVEIGRLWPPTP